MTLESVCPICQRPYSRDEMARSHIATDRDQSIQRQVALKCAVELAIGMLGPVPEGQRAGLGNAAYVVAIYRQFRDALNETE